MMNGRFIFTLRYRHNPLFRIDMQDVERAIIEKRPSLNGKHVELYFDC